MLKNMTTGKSRGEKKKLGGSDWLRVRRGGLRRGKRGVTELRCKKEGYRGDARDLEGKKAAQ